MLLSSARLAPPKTPRNVFFPWQVFCVHKSGAFLERNRLALRVPVNMTKVEIRDYLRSIYDAKVIKVNTLIKVPERRRDLQDGRHGYFRAGPIYKKAIVTLETGVPDEVKMIRSSRNLGRNPDLLKQNVSYGVKDQLRRRPTRHQLHSMGHVEDAWCHALPNLLADSDMKLNPDLRANEDFTMLRPDPTLPFIHGGASSDTRLPHGVPLQSFPQLDLTPWRRRLREASGSNRSLKEPAQRAAGSQAGVGTARPTPWKVVPS